MIPPATLYLSTSDDADAALLSVAGRPVAFRALAAALHAGAPRVRLPAVFRGTALEHAVAASPRARAATVWLEADPGPAEPTLLVPAAALTAAPALARMLSAEAVTWLAQSSAGDAPVVLIDAVLARALGRELGAGTPLGEALARARKSGEARLLDGGGWYVRVVGARAAAEAERRLYEGLGSPIDTWLDVALHRRLSRHVSRHAVRWGVTPNQITLASLVVGLAAARCFWHADVPTAAAGLALYTTAVVLDHADGEVARLTLGESATGEWLDVTADTVVHASLVVAMGVSAGEATTTGPVLGMAAGAGIIASAAVAKLWPPAGDTSAVGSALDALSSRNGFYAMLLLFIAALAVYPPALLPLMLVVAAGSHAYWLSRLAYALARR
ncbi:MAG: CDP-alcohol phosphatidyltransferase family protein [Candidatus Rokuibacteriota bacterium]